MTESKKSKFGWGVMLGAAGAALAGLFLTSKKGKKLEKNLLKNINKAKKTISEQELEEKAKQIFGKATKETKLLYLKSREMFINAAINLRRRFDKIDREKYSEIIESLVTDLKKTGKYSVIHLGKLKDEFLKDWKIFSASTKTKKKKS
jgi:gas vesicle protein